MTAKKNRAPRRPVPQKKQPAKAPVALRLPTEEIPDTPDDDKQPEPVMLVEPLSTQVLNLVMQIIDNANFKGSEVNNVIAVKLELARAAGLKQATPRERQ